MLDFFNIDSQLSEEERAVRDSVRRFVDERVLPIIGKCYVEGRFPKELVPEMAELGVFGANLPEEYGCAGLNNVAYGLIMQELERGDSGVRSFASVQGALAMYPIYAFGSEEQRQQHGCRRWRAGEVIGCFGLTEPDFGSNPAGMITMAQEQTDGTWLLNGAKMWITNGSHGADRGRVGEDERRQERRVDPRLHRPDEQQGLQGEGPEGQALAPRERHERARVPGRRICRTTRSCRSRVGSRARSCVSRRRATASRGARSARRWRASRRRSRTRRIA